MSCKGLTLKGKQCLRAGKNDGYCYQHIPPRQEGEEKKKPKKVEKKVEKKVVRDTRYDCIFIIRGGRRCKNPKKHGTDYCSAHNCTNDGCTGQRVQIRGIFFCESCIEREQRERDEIIRIEREQSQRLEYILALFNTFQRHEPRQVVVEPTIESLIPTEAKETLFECVVCQSNQIQTINTPCMHACYCSVCAKRAVEYSQKCPKCRADVGKISPMYI